MKFSTAFIPTTKEAPSDATLPSHIFLSRGGFVCQVASGLYDLLPLGKRVSQRIEAIIKEEMDAINAQEVELSFVTPQELWAQSGRIEKFGKELLRIKDRKENGFVLGPTHEEMMVNVVRNRITSYKQLPQHLYQIKIKFRDEARPRFGLMRGREFVMKDGYSFHANSDDLDREFIAVEAAYKRVLERMELKYRVVEADSGAIGGSGSKELMVLANSGEDQIAICSECDYAANIEVASRALPSEPHDKPEAAFNTFHTPNVKSIEALSEFFKIDPYFTLKCVAKKAIFDEGEKIVLFFLRGSDTLSETKALNATGATDLADITEEELVKNGLVAGFMGPLELPESVESIFDESLQGATGLICGANSVDYHIVGMAMEQVESPTYRSLYEVQQGDVCPHCSSGLLSFTHGIEVGHIFKLGDRYSRAMKAEFLNEKGQLTPFIMGTYGMGVSRLVAAIIEQHHDEQGCIWPVSVAPYVVNVLVGNAKNSEQLEAGLSVYNALKSKGHSVIIDDRKERFGFKMKDAELIGFPFTVIIGKALEEGEVELMVRENLQKERVALSDIIDEIEKRV